MKPNFVIGSISQVSQDTADSADWASQDESKSRNTTEDGDRKLFEGIQQYSSEKLTQPQIRRIRLLNSLLMLRKHLLNYKECMISSLVYLDKLYQVDDDISSESLNWWVVLNIYITICFSILEDIFHHSLGGFSPPEP